MELQERKLFEYFIVVALHKTKAGVPYLPEVTQQFPLKVKEDRNVTNATYLKNEVLEMKEKKEKNATDKETSFLLSYQINDNSTYIS